MTNSIQNSSHKPDNTGAGESRRSFVAEPVRVRTGKAQSLDAVIAGYLGVDIIPGFPRGRNPVAAREFLRPGKLIETDGLGFSLGGAVANTGLAMRRFGRDVELMGCIGRDTLGDLVLSLLQGHGVSGGIHRNRKAGTAYGIIMAPPGMDRIFLEDPGCNAYFSTREIQWDTVARSRLFHYGYPPLMKRMWCNEGQELRAMFERVRKLGVATSLDMALPDSDSPAGKADWRSILAKTLPLVDIFVPSVEEILFMLEPEEHTRLLAQAAGRDMVEIIPSSHYERLGEQLLAMGAGVVMIKAGPRGAYLRTGDTANIRAATSLALPDDWRDRSVWVASLPVDRDRFKNACGAGDCAVAGFLTAMLMGCGIENAAHYAMRAGRDSLYGADAFSGLSDWGVMSESINQQASGSPRRRVRIPA